MRLRRLLAVLFAYIPAAIVSASLLDGGCDRLGRLPSESPGKGPAMGRTGYVIPQSRHRHPGADGANPFAAVEGCYSLMSLVPGTSM